MTAIVFAEIQKHLKKCHNKMSIALQTGPNGRHRYFTIKRYKDKIEVVAISVDNSWMEGNNNKSFHEWTAQQYASDMSIAYGIKGTPNFVIIHPNGNLLNVSAGLSRFLKEFNDYVQELPREEIKKMLAKK